MVKNSDSFLIQTARHKKTKKTKAFFVFLVYQPKPTFFLNMRR